MTLSAGIAFGGDAAPGFAGLAALPSGHPAEALALPGVEKAVRAVLGDDWDTYAAMIKEPGKGGMTGPDYYGSTCLKGDCDAGYATLFIDPVAGEVYVAWTDQGLLFFRPTNGEPDDGWPQKAQEAYEFWPEM